MMVAIDKPIPGVDLPPEVPALAYPALVGQPRVGARVLLNVSAFARGLGTGGYALVVAFPDDLPPDPAPGPGHLVKARYTPLQPWVWALKDRKSDPPPGLETADCLETRPRWVADLHPPQ